MKILFIEFKLPYLLENKDFPAGGYAVELLNWLKGFTALECQCGVLTWKGANAHVGKKLPFSLLETYPKGKGFKFLKLFYMQIPALYKAAKSYQPDVIIQAVSGLQTGMMALIARTLKVPFIYRVASDMDVDQRAKTTMPWYAFIAYQYGLRSSSAIVCQNKYQYSAMENKFPNKDVYILYNPLVDIGEVQSRGRDERKYVAWLGTFKHAKNLKLLYKISNKLEKVDFFIGGMPGTNYDQETEEFVEKLKRLPNVYFKGYIRREEVSDFLTKSIALLNTSRFEGFSNTFLEALLCGTPVICPKRVDPDDIIHTNNLGFAAEDDDSLKDELLKLYKLGPEDYNKISKRCNDYAINNHELNNQSTKFLEILLPHAQNGNKSSHIN